jgi:cytidylate kinase
MGIVAISQTLGSLGSEIGRQVAETHAYRFADQEIIVSAAARYGEDITKLQHFTEEKPALRERLAGTQDRYRTYVEAIVWEMAARDDVVLYGRGGAYFLRPVRHALRVRITATEAVRIARVADEQGVGLEAATQLVRQHDRERALRVRSLYQVDWDDPLAYDLVVNTGDLTAADGAALIGAALRGARFRATPAAQSEIRDRSAAASARAVLIADARTRRIWLREPVCRDGQLVLQGTADRGELRQLAEELVRGIPGVAAVVNEIVIAADGTLGSTFQR